MGLGVGDGVGLGVGDGVADGLAATLAGASLGATVGDGLAEAATATADEDGSAAATGISIPPRWTTNPNEIPALSMRMSSAASVARGTAAAAPGPGRLGKARAPRR